jgi:misacylated tRNA(Ala) deacylase
VSGASVEIGRGRIDFGLDRMSGDLAAEVEAHLNAEVAADRAVCVHFFPRAELLATPGLLRSKWVAPPEDLDQVRVIEIVGLDMQACGGTHAACTGEVGRIHVVGHESKGRMNKRIRVALDEWVAASESKKGG